MRNRDCTQAPSWHPEGCDPTCLPPREWKEHRTVEGFRVLRHGYTFFSLRKAGCPEGQAGGGESDANTLKPLWVTRGPGLGANSKNQRDENPAETTDSRRPEIRETYQQDAFAGGRRCHRDSSQGYLGACKRGATLDPAVKSPGKRKMKTLSSSLFPRLPPGRARISASKHAVFLAVFSRVR